MRILHVLDHSLPVPSGYSVRSHSILREQTKLGWEVLAVTGPKQEIARGAIDHEGGIDYHRVVASPGRWRKLPVIDQLAVVAELRAELRRLIAREQPDVVHAHSPCLNGLAALGLGPPLVYELRSSWEDAAVSSGATREGSARYRASRALETWLLRRADAVTTICEGLRQEIAARGVDASRITVAPNAVDPRKLEQTLPDAALARVRLRLEGRFVIGFVGSFFAWEGLEQLLSALPWIRAQRPDAVLLLVGDGPEAQRLRNLAAEMGVNEHVRFAGQVPHDAVLEMYAAIDVLAFPRIPMRLTEMVTPIKPLEAMALGKPVIASDVGGHRELISHGRTGLLFEAGDARRLAECVLDAAAAPERLAQLVDSARRYVAAERTWAHVVGAYEPIYRGLLGDRKRRTAVNA